MTKTISSLLSIVAISALTIGCGSSSATSKTSTGTVIDDYIQGATVCVDSNNDGKLDTAIDKPCAESTTNATGQFIFKTDVSGSPLMMSGGTDVASGKAFTGTYTAPAGSLVINPLTTLVQAIIKDSNGTINATTAQSTVKTSLELPSGIDLTSYDPIAILSTGTDAQKEEAKQVFAQQSSIQTILTIVASTIAANISATNEAAVTTNAASQIAASMTASSTAVVINVASTSNVQTIIERTATAENNTVIDSALITAISAQVEATSSQVIASIDSTSTDIIEIREAAAQIATVVQENTIATTRAIEAGTAPAQIVANTIAPTTDGNALTTAIAAVTTVATNLTTVATEDTAPVLTGAEGAN